MESVKVKKRQRLTVDIDNEIWEALGEVNAIGITTASIVRGMLIEALPGLRHLVALHKAALEGKQLSMDEALKPLEQEARRVGREMKKLKGGRPRTPKA